MELKYHIKEKEDVVDISFNGTIGDETIDVFNKVIKILTTSEYKEVNLDFLNVDHISSSGVGKLLRLRRDLNSRNEGVKIIVKIDGELFDLFHELKMEKMFDLKVGS